LDSDLWDSLQGSDGIGGPDFVMDTKDLTESLNFVNFELVDNIRHQTSEMRRNQNRLQATGCGLQEEKELSTWNFQPSTSNFIPD
jgi:hypothetical protein